MFVFLKKLTLAWFCFALFLGDSLIIAEEIQIEDPSLTTYVSNIKRGLKKLNVQPDRSLLNLFLEVRKKEFAYPDMHQLVTAQDARFFAYQVIAKTLFEKIHEKSFPDFEFLRAPNANLFTNRSDFFTCYPSLYLTKEQAEQILSHEINSDRDDSDDGENALFPINDTLPEVSRHLISANLSLETAISLDSALYVFLTGTGVSEWHYTKDQQEYKSRLTHHIRELFDCAAILPEVYEYYLPRLIEAAPVSSRGIINQIFIPKNSISNYLYLSFAGGIFHPKDERMSRIFAKFQIDRLSPNFKIGKNIQVRLFAGALFDDAVKIFRYTLVPQHEQEAYIRFVQETINELLQTSINRHHRRE